MRNYSQGETGGDARPPACVPDRTPARLVVHHPGGRLTLVDRSRAALVAGVVFALSYGCWTPAHAELAGPEARAALARQVAHAARVRFLTLAGHVEATNVRMTAAGFASPDIAANSNDS